MSDLIQPKVSKLLYDNLIQVPNITTCFINPRNLHTQLLCNDPLTYIHTRCIKYGTSDSMYFDFKQPIWFSTEESFAKHLSIIGNQGRIHFGVVDICYVLIKLYMQGYIKSNNRPLVLDLMVRMLKGTKPSCKNLLNSYMHRIQITDFKELENDDILEIMIEQILFNHCEYIEVTIDTTMIIREINRLICS